MHGISCTTMFAWPLVWQRPVAKRIAYFRGQTPGRAIRANASIGRAPALIVRTTSAAARPRNPTGRDMQPQIQLSVLPRRRQPE